MNSDPIVFEEKGCPVCRGDIMAEESEESGFMDGEPCYCTRNCGWHGTIAVGEDGEAWAQPTDDVESLVHVIEEQRLRLIRAYDHMLLIFPDGIKAQHDQARQVFIALDWKETEASNATIQTAPSGARLQSLVGCEPSTGEKP